MLSVVENMAYFDCSNGERHRPFGPGHARQLVEDCGLAPGCVFSLPLSPAVAKGSDCGDPVSLSHPEGEEAKVCTCCTLPVRTSHVALYLVCAKACLARAGVVRVRVPGSEHPGLCA